MNDSPKSTMTLASLAALLIPAFVLADLIFTNHTLSLVALGAALVFIVICFRRLKRVATTLFAAALVFSIIYAAQGADLAAFSLVASRSAYLPAMVIVLTLLRLSTLRSTMVSEAGQFAVRQPPNRRYAFLTTGAHILGILFNIGGLILMLEIAISGRISANTPEHVAKIQMQRISTAVMRGFATTMIWSPLGISLNLLLTLVPGVTWVEFVPVGLATTIGFMLLGWVFDAVQNPNPARGTIIPRGGRFRAFVGLVAVLASINAIAALVELVFDLPIRAAILIVVPIFAFLWAIVTGKPELPAHSSMAELGRQSLSRFPEVANEICILTCVGYLGLLIASLVPSELVSEFARTAHLQNGFLAAALCSLVLTASLVGINPFITATILVTSVVDAGLQIHPILLIISLQIGWSLTLILSPVTSTIAIISGIVGQSATTVGIKWNGLYSATILTIALAIFLGLIGP